VGNDFGRKLELMDWGGREGVKRRRASGKEGEEGRARRDEPAAGKPVATRSRKVWTKTGKRRCLNSA